MYLFWIVVLLFFSGCGPNSLLHVQMHRIVEEDFASIHVGTPDSSLEGTLGGEELLVSWTLSEKQFRLFHTQLALRVRFTDGNEEERTVPLQKQKGWWRYQHIGACYREHGQMEAYLAQILQDGQPIAEQKHALWIEPILFSDELE